VYFCAVSPTISRMRLRAAEQRSSEIWEGCRPLDLSLLVASYGLCMSVSQSVGPLPPTLTFQLALALATTRSWNGLVGGAEIQPSEWFITSSGSLKRHYGRSFWPPRFQSSSSVYAKPYCFRFMVLVCKPVGKPAYLESLRSLPGNFQPTFFGV